MGGHKSEITETAHLQHGVDSHLVDALQGGVHGGSGASQLGGPHNVPDQHLPAPQSTSQSPYTLDPKP